MAEQAAEKVVSGQDPCPQRLKPDSKQYTYRSAQALRHPKARARSTKQEQDRVFPQAVKPCPTRNLFLKRVLVKGRRFF
jgi:hypothetical protein